MLAFKEDETWVPWTNQPRPLHGEDSYQLPFNAEDVLTGQDLLRYGLRHVTPLTIPPGQALVSSTIEEVNGELVEVGVFEPTPIDERRASLRQAVSTYGELRMRSGYQTNAFGAPEILQLRDALDERNWMASLGAYTAAVVGGHGATQGAIFRTLSNTVFTVTFAQGMAILTAMQQWCAALMQTSWAKEDAITAAADHAALDALEASLEDGWP